MNIRWTPTHATNQNHGSITPKYIIIHTSGHARNATDTQELNYLTRTPNLEGFYHYYILRDGSTHQLVPDTTKAWHAGESKWGDDHDLNNLSIGAAFAGTNTPDEQQTPEQKHAMKQLTLTLMQRHNIPPEHVLGHKEITTRKTDPISINMTEFRESLTQNNPRAINTLVLNTSMQNLLRSIDQTHSTNERIVLRNNFLIRTEGDKVDVRINE